MNPQPTKSRMSDKELSDLRNEVGKLTVYMCNITDHISTPKIERGCNISKDLRDNISDLTHDKTTGNTIDNIRKSLEEISDIAVGIEVGVEDILVPARKTKRHIHSAKKLIMSPVP